MSWKYGMILVDIDSTDPDDIREICELVELYNLEGEGYTSFCKAKLLSPKDLELAAKNIADDGVNRWFYENGTFSVTTGNDTEWTWKRKRPIDKALDNANVLEYEEEIDLYTIYGGD